MPIGIYGAGGFGRELAALLAQTNADHLACFVDDTPTATTIRGLPVYTLSDAVQRFPGLRVALGIGSSHHRRHAAERAHAAGCPLLTVIHPSITIDHTVTIGTGVVICGVVSVTVNVQIGDGVQINPLCSIGHDAILGAYCQLSPGVHISGFVTLEPDVFIGTGAVISNGRHGHPLTIGRGAVIGAGACVLHDVPPGARVGGVPAKPLPIR